MRKIFSFAIISLAALCLGNNNALAQTTTESPVNLQKYVTGPENGKYTLTLETYAKGTAIKKESTIVPPVNIIILIDVSKAMHTNQQPEPLSNAVKNFIDTYPAPTDQTKSHNITVITYDNKVKDVWQKVSGDSKTTEIRNKIKGYGTSGSLFSQPEYAFKRAITEATAFAADPQASKNQTMVLFFTSAARLTSGELSWYKESSISTVQLSYVLKHNGALPDGHKSIAMYSNRDDKGNGGGQLVETLSYENGLNCKIYSIANFKKTKSASKGEENNVKHLFNFTSSLYPDKWVTSDSEFNTTSGDGTEEPNTTPYHQYSPDAEDIGEMFKKVQEDIKQPDIPINESSIVKDIVTPDFKLPNGINIDNVKEYIKVYTQDCVYSGSPNYTYTFDAKRVDITSSVYVSLEGDRTINVWGYNYAEHYCGYDEKNGKKIAHDGGQKLVITIPIEPIGDYQGGYNLPTNTPDSGIYIDEDPLEKYPIPTLDFPSIGIIKKGLAVGESATFTVQRSGDAVEGMSTKFNVILTNTGSGVPYAILKDIPEGTYTITETDWSWTYGVDQVGVYNKTQNTFVYENKSATIQVLSEDMVTPWSDHGIEETTQCVLVVFTNSKETTPAINPDGYAEAVANNKFRKAGASSGNSSTTINSKSQPHAQE